MNGDAEPEPLPPPLRFLDGGGDATRLILTNDWSGHPLGPPTGWPDALKAALSLVLNSPESMMLCWGPDDLFLFFNDAYAPLLGPRLGRATGVPFREVWADAWDQAQPIIADAFAGRSQRFIDLPWKLDTDRGAADTWFTFSYSRVLHDDGAVAGLFVFTNETTERVLADAALREREEQLRLVVEGARDHAIFTTDPAGTITSWSPGAALIFGWPPEEAIGRPAAIIFTPEDLANGVEARELSTAAREGCANDERWHLTRTGDRVFMNGSVHPLPPDAQGRPRGFLKVARDETERWRTDDALSRSEARYRALFTAIDDGFCIIEFLDGPHGPESDYLHVEANPGYERQTGIPDIVGKTLRQIAPDEADGWVRIYGEVLRTGEPVRFERAFEAVDRIIEVSAARLEPASRRQVSVLFRDITPRKRAEAELRQLTDTLEQRVAARTAELMVAEEQLRQAQKMEAVGQLTGGIAHDFNNMLTGVIGSLDLLKRQLAMGRTDRADRYIDAAATSAQRAAGLTHRLLAFSRRQSLDVKAVDVNALVAGMEDLLSRTLGEQVGLEVHLHAATWPAMTDANQLESALLNLAINARDAMPAGGRLTVETANATLDASYAQGFDGLTPGEFVAISVSDTGEGMSEDTRARAFEPFFTTKPIGAGTGLGLSMIYGFARQSGGHARLYSELGHGTTVKLYLPRHRGERTAAAEAVAGPAATGAGEQVLLVEDDPAVRMLVGDVLGDLGYRVREAGDGREAAALLDEMGPLDLLITDVGLPGMNGRQLAEYARERRPGLKVLFVTGYAERAAIRGEFLAEGMDMITKPFAIDALADKIRAVLG